MGLIFILVEYDNTLKKAKLILTQRFKITDIGFVKQISRFRDASWYDEITTRRSTTGMLHHGIRVHSGLLGN